MRTLSASAASILLVLATAANGRAQDTTRAWSLGANHESDIYVGYATSSHFRFESEIAVRREHDQARFQSDNGVGGVSTFEDNISTSSYRGTLGLLWQWQNVERVRFYAGPRFGLLLARSEERVAGDVTGKGTGKRTDFWFAGSLGVEYFPVSRFSAGADVQLRAVVQGDVSETNTGSTAFFVFPPSEPTLATRGLLVVRFYP